MKVAIYCRVSTTEQNTENQLPDLECYAKSHGMEITGIYQEEASAWKAGHQKELSRLLTELRSGQRKYDCLLIWSLDRLSRQGIGPLLQLVGTFERLGCKVVSVKEEFTNVSGEMRDIFLALLAWVAKFESTRRSERVRAGLDRRKKTGEPMKRRGKDKDSRHKAGYLSRWAGKQTSGKNKAVLTQEKEGILT